MKKLFFTAIALVAFSGVSMANTITDEEIITENDKDVQIVRNKCIEIANALMELHPEAWGDPGTYIATWSIIYSNCNDSQPK